MYKRQSIERNIIGFEDVERDKLSSDIYWYEGMSIEKLNAILKDIRYSQLSSLEVNDESSVELLADLLYPIVSSKGEIKLFYLSTKHTLLKVFFHVLILLTVFRVKTKVHIVFFTIGQDLSSHYVLQVLPCLPILTEIDLDEPSTKYIILLLNKVIKPLNINQLTEKIHEFIGKDRKIGYSAKYRLIQRRVKTLASVGILEGVEKVRTTFFKLTEFGKFLGSILKRIVSKSSSKDDQIFLKTIRELNVTM